MGDRHLGDDYSWRLLLCMWITWLGDRALDFQLHRQTGRQNDYRSHERAEEIQRQSDEITSIQPMPPKGGFLLPRGKWNEHRTVFK